jgi:hypothetical protein
VTKWTNREDGPVHDMYEYIVLSVCVHVPLLLLHRVVNMLHPNTIASKTLPIIRTVFDIVRSIRTFLVSDWYRIVGHHSSNTKRTSTVRDDHYMDVTWTSACFSATFDLMFLHTHTCNGSGYETECV